VLKETTPFILGLVNRELLPTVRLLAHGGTIYVDDTFGARFSLPAAAVH
jgi:hypothetical protein